jgi:Transposase DDE domain group 1
MRNCTKTAPAVQLNFCFPGLKIISGSFDEGNLSSDGGLVLLKAADEKFQLSEQIGLNLEDKRQSGKVRFSLVEMILQRLFMICTGNEDVNDADRLASDPMHKLACGQNPESDSDLASDSTLGRLENKRTEEELERLQQLLVWLFVQRQTAKPFKLVIDIDGTCDPTHGAQQLSFFNGFYGTSCFYPLFLFIGDFPIGAILRAGIAGPAEGTVEALKRVVKILREAFPKVQLELRADAGFDEPDIYEYCERNKITYYIGFPSNSRLTSKAEYLVAVTKQKFRDDFSKEGPEEHEMARVIADVAYAADSWRKRRRIIARCDYTASGIEFRYVVTNHRGGRPAWLYEEKYCKRAQCENVIKELKSIKCDRLSNHDFKANQFRLLLHTFAYILLDAVRQAGPAKDRRISLKTLQLRLIKVAVKATETARKVFLRWPTSYPWQEAFTYTALRLSN